MWGLQLCGRRMMMARAGHSSQHFSFTSSLIQSIDPNLFSPNDIELLTLYS